MALAGSPPNVPSRVAPRPKRFGQRLYDLLHKRLRLSWAGSIRTIRAVKIALHPLDALRRRQLAGRVMRQSPGTTSLISRAAGSVILGNDVVPGLPRVAQTAGRIFEQIGDPRNARLKNKKHLVTIMQSEEFAGHPELIEFAVSRPVVDAAIGYFGTVPILASITLFWTPANESVVSSQLYHLDGEDFSQLKLFVNIWDTGEDQGPFTFLPAELSSRLLERLTPEQSANLGDRRFEDDFVLGSYCEGDLRRLIGPAGSAAIVDTSRCLHFGSRGNVKERLVLMFQFVPAHYARESSTGFRSKDWVPDGDYDSVQKLVLGI